MTTFDQPAIDFDAVSEPISGETKATVELVGNDWRSDEDWERFTEAVWINVWEQAPHAGVDDPMAVHINPNRVRALLTNEHGLTIEPRRYSAFWSRAAGKYGFLDADGWVLNEDVKGGNRGKPLRRYRLRNSP